MAVIALFAGHGGSDPGAVSGSLLEKDFTLELANAASAKLKEAGHTVLRNRVTDATSTISQKAALANSGGAQAVVEIHLNSNVGKPGTGTEVYHGVGDEAGKELGARVLERITALGFRNRGLKTRVITAGADAGKDYFGIIRRTDAPAILVETAFINNPDDMAMLDIGKVAGALADGILDVFPPVAPQKLYRVQAGAFAERQNALNLAQKLKEAGFDSIIKYE